VPYDLGAFLASDMVSSAAALKALCSGAPSREEAARRLVRALYEGLVARATGERECALVRLYVTKPLGALDDDLRSFALGSLGIHLTELPMTPESVLAAIDRRDGGR